MDKPIININQKKEEYQKYLQSNHWKNLRSKVIWTGKICDICGENEAEQAHHRVYKNLYDVEPSDLIAVCQPCHTKIHQLIDLFQIRADASIKQIRAKLALAHTKKESNSKGKNCPPPKRFKREEIKPLFPADLGIDSPHNNLIPINEYRKLSHRGKPRKMKEIKPKLTKEEKKAARKEKRRKRRCSSYYPTADELIEIRRLTNERNKPAEGY